MSNLKTNLKKIDLFMRLYQWVQMNILKRNKIRKNGSKNLIVNQGSLLTDSTFSVIGNYNNIIIGTGCYVDHCTIFIKGNNNLIEIRSGCILKKTSFWIEDDNNSIKIGDGTSVEENTQLACIEGCSIEIGKDCMFSGNITVTTGDSHSIINLQGLRINPSADIEIGEHVWVGNHSMIFKGSRVPSYSIIGAGSLVNKKFEQNNVILAGFPAKEIKFNINWKRERF